MASKKSKTEVVNSAQDEQTIITSGDNQTPEYAFISTEDAKAFTKDQLDAKIDELETVAKSFGDEVKSKKYNIQVGSLKTAKGLLKFIEKNVKWNHQTLPGFISVCHALKDSIRETGVSEDGFIGLNGGPVGMIYQTMLQVSGNGYFEAKEYLQILTEVGAGISDAMKELADDNTMLRNIHTDLSTLDTEKTAREQGIEVTIPAAEA